MSLSPFFIGDSRHDSQLMAFDEVVAWECRSVMQETFMDPGWEFIRRYLERCGLRLEDIPREPRHFDSALKRMLGESGAQFIKIVILRGIYSHFGTEVTGPVGSDFEHELEEARRLLAGRSSRRVSAVLPRR